ncbi:translation initiation factor IF3-4, chloroplastic-like [Impatiens glandulifera]|uniref:translation initiation factor IF3-4, chloroplastic-like n=1 Tax=Impatiens glandulifera TaxID=253017 RepID=UPI001FB066F2|nr:translation initiation factor IF3-4, chloroplastic-like [Impatiens glandulifera]
MAGITSTFTCRPLLSRSNHFPTPQSTLSSLQSNQCHLLSSSLSNSNISVRSSSTFSISARYGGRGAPSQSRAPSRASDYDEALDISSIRSDTVRLIDEQQNMVGLLTKREAIKMAEDAELDLVILSPEADPPVVRIMDYNKYKYEQQRKKKAQQKKSAAGRMDLKELKMGYNIDDHDYTVRLKAAQKFLKDGDKVKVVVNLKGRENEFRNNAIELLRRFQNDVGEQGAEEAKGFRDRNMFIILVPNKIVAQKSQEQQPPKKKEDSATTTTTTSPVSTGV